MGTFKIDFLVIGTQKGGTTALDYYLRSIRELKWEERRNCISLIMKNYLQTLSTIL